jgi:hypothetical protein
MGFLEGDVRIINLALIELGEKTITARSDTTEPGITMNLLYDHVRDEEMEKHPWAFAMARAQLSEDTSSPAFEWTNQFVLPADYLRAWRLYNTVVGPNYVIEGNLLLTDEETCYLRYIKRVTDTTKFSNLFVRALAAQLAMRATARLTSNRTKMADLSVIYDNAIRDAMLTNAILDLDRQPPENEEENYSWVKR